MAVALVRKMDIDFLKDDMGMAEKFAISLMDLWGVGYYPCNNGVVIFLSQDDRVLYIYAGKGKLNVILFLRLKGIILT